MSQYELESQWVKGSLSTVKFRFDDRVRAISGKHKGKAGRIVALLAIDPSPLYAIEEPEGTNFNARQSELERQSI